MAAICHAPWVLVEADVLRGRRTTSWPSLQTDLRNAGATWLDEEVVVDGDLVTSRKPDDLDSFSAAIVEQFAAAAPAEDADEVSWRRTPSSPPFAGSGRGPGWGHSWARAERAGRGGRVALSRSRAGRRRVRW
jgi:DJ-1/PfpI family protein